MIELSILKLFIDNRDIYNKYIEGFKRVQLEPELRNILKLIDKYYCDFEDRSNIEKDNLISMYEVEYPVHKDKALYQDIIQQIFKLEPDAEVITKLMRQVIAKDYANQMANCLLPVLSGQEEPNNFEMVREYLQAFDNFSDKEEEESPFYEPALEDILQSQQGDGLEYGLDCLKKGLGPLCGGTLGHIFARPETGKTSFCHSEVSNLVKCITDDDLILWINNEEAGDAVLLRWWTVVTGMSEEEIRNNPGKAKHLFKQNGGHRMKFIDEASVTVEQIEAWCKDYKPRMVVIDQGDKVHYKGEQSAGNGADRLKAVYDRLREVVKRCNKEWKIDILTIGQADAAAEGKRRLFLSNLDSGKTGKAGAFDYIIGIGKGHDDQSSRYINFCKNKLKTYHAAHMVSFDAERGKYYD